MFNLLQPLNLFELFRAGQRGPGGPLPPPAATCYVLVNGQRISAGTDIITACGAPAPPAADNLLLESGDALLLESGDEILLESA